MRWIGRELEQQALGYAVAHLVPEHLDEVRGRAKELVDKTEAAVKDRLTKEINYWDHRAAAAARSRSWPGKANAAAELGEPGSAPTTQARLAEAAGGAGAGAQSRRCRRSSSAARWSCPPGLLAAHDRAAPRQADARRPTPQARALRDGARRHGGRAPARLRADRRELEKLGYDIESRVPGTGRLRFIEVKGRVAGADTITVTQERNPHSLNKPDDFILAIVEFDDDDRHDVRYVRQPFQNEPDFGATNVLYGFAHLLSLATPPRLTNMPQLNARNAERATRADRDPASRRPRADPPRQPSAGPA